MGFWNVRPKDLRIGDEIRVTTMGGEEYLTVEHLEMADTTGDHWRVRLAWGWHVPRETFEELLKRDENLVVRR